MVYSLEDKETAQLMRQDESRIIQQMLQQYTIWEPFDEGLRRQLNLIGVFIRTWLNASKAFHFFTNPDIDRVHWMPIGEDETMVANKFEEKLIHIAKIDNIQKIRNGNLKDLCHQLLGPEQNYLILPFAENYFAFGNFVLSFKTNMPNDYFLEKIRGTLNILRNTLQNLLYNHYHITNFSYLPFFYALQTREAAILFCDIRNSTEMFKTVRNSGNIKYTNMILELLKSLFKYASSIIAIKNIGRIHCFMGDGFLSTFGEPLMLDPKIEQSEKAKAACAMSLLTAKLLVEGFDKLWNEVKNHKLYNEFIVSHFENLETRLGIGINYGIMNFDFFGILKVDIKSGLPQGYGDFLAVGDNVNFTDRLCAVANQPISSINISERSKEFCTRLTAPIIVSQPVVAWCQECFKRNGDPLTFFRSDFKHKGTDRSLPAFEFWPQCIDVDCLLEFLTNIHHNRFYNAIHGEVTKKPDDRPELNEIIRELKNGLDNILNNKVSI